MNATTPSRDPAELEREATQIRADMDRTLDALERKLSPQQMLDRSLGYIRDHGGGFTRTVGDTVKQNPIPVLLTAAGLAWLITSSVRSRSESSTYDEYGTAPYDDTYGVDETVGDTETTGSRFSGIRRSMSSRWRRGKASMRQRADSMRDSIHSSTDATSGRMSNAMNSTRDRAAQAQQRAQTMMDEQPLIVGALALAAGAIIGAALPTTDYENRTLGPIRDRTMDRAKEKGQRTMERAKETGQREYENLRSRVAGREDMEVSGRADH